ncbi:MAG: hypothetical protein HFJ66_06300 [Eggerthellaceae bacterium]|nr:hypothetical protein [Eggerthellaceae bacterium]
MRIRPFAGAICAVSLAAGVTLYGCQSTDASEQTPSLEASQEQAQPQEPQESAEPAPEEPQPEPEAPKLSEEIIGVWQSDNDDTAFLAFDGTNYFSTVNGTFSLYSVDNEAGTVEIDVTESTTIVSISNGTTLSVQGKGRTYPYTKTDFDAAQFIEENHIVLKPGDTWENEDISIEALFGDYYENGEIPLPNNGMEYRNEATFAYTCNITSKTDDELRCDSDFVINNKTRADGSITLSGMILSPLSEEATVFSYAVPEKNASAIERCDVLFAYRNSKTGELVTPWITLSLS